MSPAQAIRVFSLALLCHLRAAPAISIKLTLHSEALAPAAQPPPLPERNETGTVSTVTVNGPADLEAAVSTLQVSGIGALVVLFAFCILRYQVPTVYTRAATKDEYPVQGFTDWVARIWTLTDEEEVAAAGLDGWTLLEFHRLNQNILNWLAPVMLGVLCPLTYLGTGTHARFTAAATNATANEDAAQLPFLDRFDIGNLPSDSRLFWLHGGLVWVVVLVCARYIVASQRRFLSCRFEWLRNIPRPQSTTLMIENIPRSYRSDFALLEYFRGIFTTEAVERAYLVRKTKELRRLLQRLSVAEFSLTRAEAQWDRAGRPQERRWWLDTCERRYAEVKAEVVEERERIEHGVVSHDPAICSGSGFVTFSSRFWQRAASNEQYSVRHTEFMVGSAPDPTDVSYENLETETLGSKTYEVVGWLCLILLFLLWSPVVVFISGLTTLSRIEYYVPAVRHILEAFPSLKSYVEGFLATMALRVFMLFLPSILLAVINLFFPLKARASAQLRLEQWYFTFLLLFVLLVTSVGRSLILSAVMTANNPTYIFEEIANTLPSTSHFYFNYLMSGWLAAVFNLLRISQLVQYSFYRCFCSFGPEKAKENSEPEDEATLGMGCRMASAVLMSAITLVFCSCSPFVVFFAWVYFGLGQVNFGYLLVFAETKKPDLGGLFFIEALKQLFLILLLYVVLMTGVVALRSGNQWGPSILTFSAVLVLWVTWLLICDMGWEALPLEELVKVDRGPGGAPRDEPTGVYIQPECDPAEVQRSGTAARSKSPQEPAS